MQYLLNRMLYLRSLAAREPTSNSETATSAGAGVVPGQGVGEHQAPRSTGAGAVVKQGGESPNMLMVVVVIVVILVLLL